MRQQFAKCQLATCQMSPLCSFFSTFVQCDVEDFGWPFYLPNHKEHLCRDHVSWYSFARERSPCQRSRWTNFKSSKSFERTEQVTDLLLHNIENGCRNTCCVYVFFECPLMINKEMEGLFLDMGFVVIKAMLVFVSSGMSDSKYLHTHSRLVSCCVTGLYFESLKGQRQGQRNWVGHWHFSLLFPVAVFLSCNPAFSTFSSVVILVIPI